MFRVCTLVVALCSLGCVTQTAIRPAIVSEAAQFEAGLTLSEQELAAGLCPFGIPTSDDEANLGKTTLVIRDGYALEHSGVDKIPMWVCERVTREHLDGDAERGPFKPDPKLKTSGRAELADYKGSGFDRGHQAPAADFKYDQERMNETFFLSNMCPQVGRGFNQNIWRVLEDRTRKVVKRASEAYVITGPIFYDPAEDNPDTADGVVKYSVIGKGEVAVPTHFFKIVVVRDSSGEWRALAFVLENEKYDIEADSAYDFSDYIQSIDWVEDHTGINFLPDLDTDEPALEKALERSPGSNWTEYGTL